MKINLITSILIIFFSVLNISAIENQLSDKNNSQDSDCNCRKYKNIKISDKNEHRYNHNEEKKHFYKKKLFYVNDKKIVIEDNIYKGFLTERRVFSIKVFDAKNNLVVKKKFDKEINDFQAIKRKSEIILILEIGNGRGSNIEIISFDSKLNFNEIYKIEGRDGFWDFNDVYDIGDVVLDDKGGFLLAIQLSIYYEAKFVTGYGDFVLFYKFDKNNKLSWQRKLVIPEYDFVAFESENGKLYIKDNYLYKPVLFNGFTNLKRIDNCYLIYNDIANLYGYYAIDNDGYFWTKDPVLTRKVEKVLFPKREELSDEDKIYFIGFLLLLLLYFIYKRNKKNKQK